MEHPARTNEAPRIPAPIHGAPGAAALELRPARAADLPALADILRDLWHTDVPSGAYAHLEGLHDVLCCLDRSTHHLVAALDGAPVGICCGCTGAPAPAGPWHAEATRAARALDELDPEAAAQWDAYRRAAEDINRALIAQAGLAGAAEVVLLAVGAAARGRGIGRELLGRMEALLAQGGAVRAFLCTDTDCDWPFYERLGLARVAAHRRGPRDLAALPTEMYVYRVPLATRDRA
ncbi:MAG TPA: GNAT family N-acetyltransferase [Candidatus Coprousia avicola]|nr:GNAT family N-acetyltransferase [Candidatus Coprousia avicola]